MKAWPPKHASADFTHPNQYREAPGGSREIRFNSQVARCGQEGRSGA
jgi:hypothetical protein